MFAPLTDLALLSVVAGVVSLTITYTPLTARFRHWMIGRPLMLGELVSCPYCMAHWIALGLSWGIVGGSPQAILLNAAVITGGAALFCGILLKLFLFRERENEELRELLVECKEAVRIAASGLIRPDRS